MKQQKDQVKSSEEQYSGKPDPSIRNEFPGAGKTNEKLKEGKRNTGTKGDKKVKPEDDVPENDAEPVQS